MTYPNCPAVLESYLRYLTVVKNQAPSTIDARYRDIRDFLQFLSASDGAEAVPVKDVQICNIDVAAVAAVTEDDIEDFLDYLTQERHVSGTSIYRRKRGSLHAFFDYLIRHQEELGITMTHNPVPEGTACSPAQSCRILTPSEISRVLKAIQGEAATRDLAIVLLISTTGISLHELVKIRCDDYREDTMLVAGRKVYLTESCQKALDDYLAEYRDPASEWIYDNALFVSRNYRRRLTPRGIQKALQKHFDRAGVKGTARDLRHTAVMELLKTARNECERSYLAGCLGYTNPRSLEGLPLPKPSKEDALPDLMKNTWLNDLGH